MTLDSAFDIPAHVIAREVGGETVILDLDGGSYFGLDAVGARIWGLLNEGLTLAAIRDRMVEDYDASAEEIERDLLGLARELSERRLVEERA